MIKWLDYPDEWVAYRGATVVGRGSTAGGLLIVLRMAGEYGCTAIFNSALHTCARPPIRWH